MASKRIDRTALAEVIRNLDGISNDQRADLLQLLNEQKRYGLVWEEHTENAEEKLREQLPVLKEVDERRILSDDAESPNHILIEGDNLHALTALTYTHEGKVDVIYIDPPYNTGNKDFIYNDSFVDAEDGYRHSKWLSFMSKRLRIAKKLMTDGGVGFISIGDDELANLILLCKEIFDVIAVVPRVAKSGSDQGTFFRPTKDYVLVVSKNRDNVNPFSDPFMDNSDKEYELVEPETNRRFRKAHSFFQSSLDPLRGCVNQRYYMKAPDGTLIIPPGNVMPNVLDDGAKAAPVTKADKVWRWSVESYLKKKNLVYFSKSKRSPLIDSNGNHTDWNAYEKKYEDEELQDQESPLPNDIIYNYTNSLATTLLNSMGLNFSFSKPIELINYLITITNNKNNIIILDFFAGSGTTLHATMQLNAEDGGTRQCILVTNNENNICEEVTYERNKRVINGYTTSKGEQVEGLKNNNLRYYKVDFVERDSSMTAKKKLMEASTELLCIKQDLYVEKQTFGSIKLNSRYARYFDDGKKQMLVIYNTDAIESLVMEIEKMPDNMNIMTYVFSTNNYALDADFEDVADKVTLCALPAAIYNAYLNVLPKKENPKTEEDETETIPGE